MANSRSLVILLFALGIFQTIHCGHHHGRDEDPRAVFDSLFDSIQGKVQIQNNQDSHAAKSSKSSQQQLSAGSSMAGNQQQQQSSQDRNQEQANQPPQPAPIQAPQPPPPTPISKKAPAKPAPGYDQSRDAQDASNNDAPPPPPPAPKPRPPVSSDDASPKPRPPAPSNGYSDRTRSSSKTEKKESVQQSAQMSANSNQQVSQADDQDVSQSDKKNGNQADGQSNDQSDQSNGENQHAHAIPENNQRSAQVQNSNSAQQVDTDSQDQNDNAKPAPPAPMPVRPRQAPTVPQTQTSNQNGNLQPQPSKPSSASLQSQGAALVGSRSAKVPTAASMVSSAMDEDDEDEMDSSPFSSRVGMIQPDMLKVFAQMSGSFVPTACQTDSDCTVKGFACSRLLNKCVPGSASSNGQAKCGTAQLCSTDADCCAGERCDSFGGLLERQRCRRGDSNSNITSVISSSGRNVPGSNSAQLPQAAMAAASNPIKARSSSSDDGSILPRRMPINAPSNQVAPPSAQPDQDNQDSEEASTNVNIAGNSTIPSGSNVTQIAAPADQDQSQDSSNSNDGEDVQQSQSAAAGSSGEGSDQQAQQRVQLGPMNGQQSAFAARGVQASGRGVKVNSGASVSSTVVGPSRPIPGQQVEQELQSQDSTADQSQGPQSMQSNTDETSKNQSADNTASSAGAPGNDDQNQALKPKNLSLSKLLINSQPRNVAQVADVQEKSMKIVSSGNKQAKSSNTAQIY